MKNKKHKLKNAIIGIALSLLIIAASGLGLQLFMPDGNKVSDWVDKIKNQFVAEPPAIEVGDEITELYGNTKKSTAEVVAMLDRLDWDNVTAWGGGVAKKIDLGEFVGEDEYVHRLYVQQWLYSGKDHTYDISVSLNPNVTSGKTNFYLFDDVNGWTSEAWIFNPAITVKSLEQYEIWQNFIFKA